MHAGLALIHQRPASGHSSKLAELYLIRGHPEGPLEQSFGGPR